MKKLMLILVVLAAMWQVCFAEDTLDDPGNNKILWVQNFKGLVHDCAFMPDEDYIIIAKDSVLEIRRTKDQSFVKEINIRKGKVLKRPMWDYWPSEFDISDDGKYVAVGGGNFVYLLDINSFLPVREYQIYGDRPYREDTAKWVVKSVDLSNDGKKLACVGYHFINVIDVETGNQIFQFGQDRLDAMRVNIAKFSPDGKWLACNYIGGDDKKIYVFDTETWQLYYGFNGDDRTPDGAFGHRLLFSPNSNYLLAEDANGFSFRIWDIESKVNIVNDRFGGAGIIQFFNDNETIFFRTTLEGNSIFYNIRLKKVIREVKMTPPITRTSQLNKAETLLLGDRLCLTQIDKSILSVEPEGTDEKDNLLIPNPATNEVLIRSKMPYNDFVSIDLTDITGKLINVIYSQFVNEGAFEFRYDITNLAPGSYFFRLRQKSYSTTFKLIKEG